MNNADLVYYGADYSEFRKWIDLNLDALTWQGRYVDEFESFWTIFFLDGLNLKQIFQRFSYVTSTKQIGPISSWFVWLRNKFLVYTFIEKKISISTLAKSSGLSVNETAYLLREFFVCKYPEFDNDFNLYFQIGNVASQNYNLTFDQLQDSLGFDYPSDGILENDVMQSMEITLYKEWKEFLNKLKRDMLYRSFQLDQLLQKSSLNKLIKFAAEVVAIAVVGALIVYLIKIANVWYEEYLVERISVNEPTLTWIEDSLRFKAPDDKKDLSKIKAPSFDNISSKALEETVTKDIDRVQLQDDSEFKTESEIALTSLDSLPKDFTEADLESSEYEEVDKGDARDTQYGNRKVFRIIMNSSSPDDVKVKLNNLLQQYRVTQVDNVKPGQKVPGGIYYNIYVPRFHLKEFMAKVVEVDDAMIYETRTRGVNPPNKNRVFIWIKQI